MKSFSQAAQDLWVAEMTANKRDGFFVDLGAYDGVQTSNTFALEAELGWSGICVEANVDYFERLKSNRPKAINVHAAVTGSVRTLHFSGQLETSDGSAPSVQGLPLADILRQCAAPPIIDYMSIDIEGMEREVLSAFDFSLYQINLLTIEHNLYCDGPANKEALFALLTSSGFVRVIEDAPCLDPNYYMLPYEDWYANAAFLAA